MQSVYVVFKLLVASLLWQVSCEGPQVAESGSNACSGEDGHSAGCQIDAADMRLGNEDVTSLLMTGVQVNRRERSGGTLEDEGQDLENASFLFDRRRSRRRSHLGKYEKIQTNVTMLEGCDKTDVKCQMEKSFRPVTHLLTLTLISGTDIKNANKSWVHKGKTDPSCTIMLVDGSNPGNKEGWPKYKYGWETKHLDNTLNPVWNFQFSTAAFTDRDFFDIECFDDDGVWPFKSKEKIGEHHLGIIALLQQEQERSLQKPGGKSRLSADLDAADAEQKFQEVKLRSRGSGRLGYDVLKIGVNNSNIKVPLYLNDKTEGYLTFSAAWLPCNVPWWHVSECNSNLLAMGAIAGMIYKPYSQIGDWHLIVNSIVHSGWPWSDGNDIMGIYKKLNTQQCALVFKGSSDIGDWKNNLRIKATKKCGWDMHSGFHAEAQGYIGQPVMGKWADIIRKECGNKVEAVGHSLGGACASIVAGCANRGKLADLAGKHPAPWTVPESGSSDPFVWHASKGPFKVQRLWTIGAPATTLTPMTDGLHQTDADVARGGTCSAQTFSEECDHGLGCFRGARAVNVGRWADLVPSSSSYLVNKYKHPKMAGIKLHHNGRDEIIGCNDADVVTMPTGGKYKTDKSFWQRLKDTAFGPAHAAGDYINRLGRAFINMPSWYLDEDTRH
jgi:hypothetical protein